MNKLLQLGLELEQFCRKNNWKFCFIGAIAVQRWGEPRLTQDLDITIISGFGDESSFIDVLLDVYVGRIENAKEFALRNRVLLLKNDINIPIDVSLGAMPFEERAAERASQYKYAEDVLLTTCSAEDLIVLKAFANRDKDWIDIEGIIARQGNKLNLNLIYEELRPLVELKEEPEILAKFNLLKRKILKC
jgi:hypothetical protein